MKRTLLILSSILFVAVAVAASYTGTNTSDKFWSGDLQWRVPAGGGGGSQTPILQDVDFGGFMLTNAGRTLFTKGWLSSNATTTATTEVSNGVFTAAITNAPAAITTSIRLTNSQVAASGAQEYSPAIEWAGNGWKTTATAASQPVNFRAYVVPVQGAANPTAKWTLESSVNNGAYANALTYDSAGTLNSAGGITYTGDLTGGNVKAGSGGTVLGFAGGPYFERPLSSSDFLAYDGSLVAGASVRFGLLNVAKTANYSVVAADIGKYFNNIGAGTPITNTLPTAVAGMHFAFVVSTNSNHAILAAGSDVIYLGDTRSGTLVYSSITNAVIHLFSPKALVWVVDQIKGSWSGLNVTPVAPTAITFPATDTPWTNTLGAKIELYIDNVGITGTAIKKNGTQILGGLITGYTLVLLPGEYFSETFSVGTPTATYSKID